MPHKKPILSLWGLAVAAGGVACGATVLGFLGSVWWFFDLFSHFRLQYLMGLGILAALTLARGERRTGGAFIAFACVNLAWVAPLYFGGEEVPTGGVQALRAMLLNVNTRAGSPPEVLEAVLQADPDVLVLEEISARWVDALAPLLGTYRHVVTHPRDDNFGIGLFSKLPLTEHEIVKLSGRGVPSIVATVLVGEQRVKVIATHPLPPVGFDYARFRDEQLGELAGLANGSGPVLVLGDLNATPWSAPFRKLLKASGLKDSAQGFGVQPTWPAFNPLLAIPIDHCLHSDDIRVVDRRVGPDVSSDHLPLIIDLELATGGAHPPQSSGGWAR